MTRVMERLDAIYAIAQHRAGYSPEEDAAHELAAGWMREAGLDVSRDEAGNLFGRRGAARVWAGSHLDSVPTAGRFDGALGVVAAVEAAARLPDAPLAVVAFRAEETGPMGSKRITEIPDAYLEGHIEQGPVLERLGLPLGVVLGSFGVERHRLRFTGAHAHAGASPMDARRDAFLAAARSAVAFRDDAARRADVRATTGVVHVSPGIPTAFNGACEITLDQRALDAGVLADMLAEARRTAAAIAEQEGCEVAWEPVFATDPMPFDRDLIALAEDVVTGVAGTCHSLPSGPLHDASEMARVLPAVMIFVRSLGGVSHTSAEDSRIDDVELGVRALYELTRRLT